MPDSRIYRLYADYNAWMNRKVYEAAAKLDAAEQTRDRGAFFGSIFGTLNHIAVADQIWLHRFAAHFPTHAALEPIRASRAPTSLDSPQFDTLAGLAKLREQLDAVIVDWIGSLTDADLDATLSYRNIKGEAFSKPLALVLLHFFNHQTHHRGQTTTLLTQAGQDVGVTDLNALIPDAGTA